MIFEGLDPRRVAANRESVEAEIADACARAGRDPREVELVAAVKYVAAGEIAVLREAGLKHAGENRAQALAEKQALEPNLDWHFIGHVQSRKVKDIVPRVSLIHAVSTDSVLGQMARHAPEGFPILVEVNVSGEAGKSGIPPDELVAFLDRCRTVAHADVRGLMTMPPLAASPEESRPWFRELAALGSSHGLEHLSMGTTQDFGVAVEEGATLVRVGTRLYA